MNAVTIIIATSASLAVMVAIGVGTLLARRAMRGGPATPRDASGRGDGARRWRAGSSGGESGAGHSWDSSDSDSGGWDGGGWDGGGGGGGD